jgi:hypothetical protein
MDLGISISRGTETGFYLPLPIQVGFTMNIEVTATIQSLVNYRLQYLDRRPKDQSTHHQHPQETAEYAALFK